MSKQERTLVVAKLLPLGPSMRVRGDFLVDVSNGFDVGRVWNCMTGRWMAYTIDVEDARQVADYRGATWADVEKYGVKLDPARVVLR